ncbi:16819_t:CDS:2 [Funneliformis caledonium]|uniref:16819_t:CDS:1 n=1 Tax=Funneliformis caledonium TaxID=1117310 RepID=A0A9N9CRC1_9GLOM|nr:16819_t:CDS:2 [Funneliformis caledonium]
MPNLQTICLSRTEDKINDGPGNHYIAKALQKKQERKINDDNSQRIKELKQQEAIIQQEI